MVRIALEVSGCAPPIDEADAAEVAAILRAIEAPFARLSVPAKRALIAQMLVELMRQELGPEKEACEASASIPGILERVVSATFAHGLIPLHDDSPIAKTLLH